MSHAPSRRRLGRTVLVALALVAGVVGSPSATPPAAAAGDPPQYYDGPIRYSTILNCPSVIQGFPYQENGAGAYTGVYADPDDGFPSVGQTTYLHIVVYGLGNACAGQRFVPAFELPAGVTLDTSVPPHCANSLTPNPTPCGPGVQLSQNASYGGDHILLSGDTANARTWGLPPGRYWEFVFAIRSDSVQTSTQVRAHVKMFDGNSSPVLRPTANLYVFGPSAPPSVLYDSPSTVGSDVMPEGGSTPTAYGLFSAANIVTNGAGGTAFLDFGTNTTVGNTPRGQVALPGGFVSHRVWTDWAEPGFAALQPGRTYYWRLRFVPTSGPTVLGARQQFTVPTAETCKGRAVTVSLALGQQPTGGDDVILGTPAAETVTAAEGNDVVCGGGGNDNLVGGPGNDVLGGSTGTDTASYAGTTSRVIVTLARTTAQGTAGAGTDTLTGVENLTGTARNDRLTGNAAPNLIDGGAGSDVCNGGAGRDTQKRCETRTSIP